VEKAQKRIGFTEIHPIYRIRSVNLRKVSAAKAATTSSYHSPSASPISHAECTALYI
jgi:hypothetical protein